MGDPPERAAELVLLLASGRVDALSECFIPTHGDVVEMTRRAGEIRRGDLWTSRQRMPPCA